MSFDKLNNTSQERGTNKKEISGKTKIIKELTSFSARHDNPIFFKDFGLDNESELTKNVKIKKEVLENLNKDNKEFIKEGLKVFQSFVTGPIFTDSFHQEHYSRFIWINVYHKKLSKNALQYYDSNRLRVNKCSDIIGFLQIFEDLVVNSDIKNKLLDLEKSVPFEFISKGKNGKLEYNSLSDDKKIVVVKKLTEIAQKVILMLEEK